MAVAIIIKRVNLPDNNKQYKTDAPNTLRTPISLVAVRP